MPYNTNVIVKRVTHNFLLWSKIGFPFMGPIGNMSKKALIMHIAKPVLPIPVKPLMRRAKKRPPKANEIRIPKEDRIAPIRFVNFGEW